MKHHLSHCLFILLIPFVISAQNGFITTKGNQLITPDGKAFLIKGTNLGNWLVPEGYMFKFQKANSPRLIQEVINELVGPDESKKFWQQYLNNYIQPADIHYLHAIGMNSIRIPFNYRLFTEEDYLGGAWREKRVCLAG